MEIVIFSIVLFVLIFIAMAFLIRFIVNKVNSQTSSVVSILTAFSNIDKNLTALEKAVEDLREALESSASGNRTLINTTVANFSRRVETLENEVRAGVERLDRTVDTLYSHCSGRMNRR